MRVETTCPFGHKCEQARDGHIERCMMYQPWHKDGKPSDERQCIILSTAYLLEGLRERVIGVQAAVESRGNETIKRQDQFLSLVQQANNRKQIGDNHG